MFKNWKGVSTEWPGESKDDAREAARSLQKLQRISKEVTKALRTDDVRYFQNAAAAMGDINDPSTGQNIWKKIRWALPKFQNRRQQSPLLLECLDDQWYGHFADLEAGLMTKPSELLQRCVHRQSTRTTIPCTSLTALPTLDEVERVLRNVQPHKAPGPDQLPGALFRYGANILAPSVHDAFLKTYTWECEAIQSKGGLMIPIYKAGDQSQARSYRGIMVLNTLSKSFHSWTRTKLMGHISGIRMPSQLGGFSHQQSQFGSQMIQTVARICAAKQLSHACLFVDVRGAYHYLVRELVMGIEDDDDLAGVIANIAQHGMDANGVKLWSTLPSILERVRADPKLVSLLKEIHADTWMTMAQSNGADGTLRTRRGSRPGSPVADAVYHVLMMDLHIEVHRILEGCDKVVQGFDAASIPITATTWADDLAVPVITETASDLIPAIQEVVSRVYTAFERRGLELNMQKNKTAAVLSFKGPAAATHRKTYLLCQHPGISFSLTGGRERWLHFTGTYRHLGAVYCADGVMTREVNSRIGAANASFQQLRKILFGNKHIPTATRLRLLEALIFSKLTYGLSTWSSLGVGLLEKVESFMLRCQRFVCGFRQEGSHDEFKGQFEIPGLHHRLMQHRLIYAASVWIHGPPLLQELLETEEQAATTSWMTALRHGSTWGEIPVRFHQPRGPQVVLAYQFTGVETYCQEGVQEVGSSRGSSSGCSWMAWTGHRGAAQKRSYVSRRHTSHS